MTPLDIIRRPVEAELKAFDEFVERQFTAEGELLSEMLQYALSSRGKGIRPLLVMLSAAMHAPVRGASLGRRPCLAAMLVEMIHVASLIHDDVIDESDLRRGRPSVNAKWQSHKAVVLGDYILARNILGSRVMSISSSLANTFLMMLAGFTGRMNEPSMPGALMVLT